MRPLRTLVAVALVSSWAALLPAGFSVGTAQADCTVAGDFGAGAGCAPPGGSSGGGGGDSWPPTSVDWPPNADSGDDSGGGSDSGGGGGAGGKAKAATPIVLPAGQSAPVAADSDESDSTPKTSETPKPIVPVGAPPLH
jgi:hypothetical protein